MRDGRRFIPRVGGAEAYPLLEVGDLRLDPASRRVWRGPTEVELSTREFALLETFLRRPGEVLDRVSLLEHAWEHEYENRSNVVDVYIRYLRRKVDGGEAVALIHTARGFGYTIRE